MTTDKHRSKSRRWWPMVPGVLLCLGILTLPTQTVLAQDDDKVRSPDECAACHEDAYTSWQDSTHASSMTDPMFIEAWARAGDPAYCKSCHATDYNPLDGSVHYEGVACLACHTDETGDHPISTMTVDRSAELCAGCHSGTHAPDYDQWLLSDHATMNISCADCHYSHNGELRMEDPTELCVSCHKIGEDEVHGQEGMACHDCHMSRSSEVVDPLSGRTGGTGHSFGISSDVCASCHGMTHTLKAADTDASAPVADEEVASCEEEVQNLAQRNRDLGLTGGGIGGLVLGLTIPWLLRRRRE